MLEREGGKDSLQARELLLVALHGRQPRQPAPADDTQGLRAQQVGL